MNYEQWSTYVIAPKDGEPIETGGASYEDAASHYARHTYGDQVTARRTTGTAGKSGYFQAYRPTGEPGHHETSVGEPFHVY